MVQNDSMEELRAGLRLVHGGRIRVIFESGSTDGTAGQGYSPAVECATCDSFLVFDERRGWWICPECSYEVTHPEMLCLVSDIRGAVETWCNELAPKCKDLVVTQKGRGKWSLARLFGRQK